MTEDNVKYTPDELENTVWSAVTGLDGKTLDEIAGLLPKLPTDAEGKESLLQRLSRAIDTSRRFFRSPDSGKYVNKAEFFTGAEFVVVPSEVEIEAGILFPGHRFAAFCAAETYLCDVNLMPENGRRELSTTDFDCNMLEVLPQHILLGSESLYDYVMAENSANAAFLRGEKSAKVKLEVFDLARYYQKTNFSSGDALVFTVEDYDEGFFSFRYLPAAERNDTSRDLWIRKYEDALQQAIAVNAEYEEIPELLAEGFFFGGRDLFGAAGASLDEFIALSEVIELRPGENGTELAVHNEFDGVPGDADADADEHEHDHDCDCGCHDHHNNNDLPEGVSASAGKVDSLASILKEAGSSLTMVELDAFIFDNFAASDFDVDALYRKLFAESLNFVDEAQEEWFRVMFEERFEYMQDHFDRQNDPEIAEIRTAVLELVEQRLNALDVLREADKVPPENELKALAECTIFFDQVLSVIHQPAYSPKEDGNFDALMDTLDAMAEKQERIIGRLGGDEA